MIKEGLWAPLDYGTQPCCYWQATPEMIKEHTGGCGPGAVGKVGLFDRMWGLNVKPCCKIHDWMYAFGEVLLDKDQSDRAFNNNLIRYITDHTRWAWLASLRMQRAEKYVYLVERRGGPAFWKGKNKDGEMC